jgi:hypothetical protein
LIPGGRLTNHRDLDSPQVPMQTDPQDAAIDPTPRGQAAGASPLAAMSVYRRRSVIVAAALVIVLAAFIAALVVDRLGAPIDPFQVAWVTLSIEIVGAVYKWGVGGWSRYTPPDQSHLAGAESRHDTTLPAPPPASPRPSVPADPPA